MTNVFRGFQSPNYTQVPNELLDDLMADMPASALKVLLAIIRLTLGYHRADARITIRRIRFMTGLSKQAVLDGATWAESRHLLFRNRTGNRPTWWTINIDWPRLAKSPHLWRYWEAPEGSLFNPADPTRTDDEGGSTQ